MRNARDRYLHSRLIKFVKNWVNKPKNLNDKDLCFDPFYDNNGALLKPYVSLKKYDTIFNFSREDIENIISNALETRKKTQTRFYHTIRYITISKRIQK